MSNLANTYKQERQSLLNQAEGIITLAENGKRSLERHESNVVDALTAQANELSEKIRAIEGKSTIRQMYPSGVVLTDGPREGRGFQKTQSVRLSDEYGSEFFEYLQSGGQKIGATLSETGGNAAGGYAVPIVVDDQIVPLAPNEMAIRRLATVLPTSSDIKFPTKASFGTSAAKAETSSFGGTQMTLGQFTLSAFILGSQNDVSWELLQDVPAFQSSELSDQILSLQMLEESYYVTGSGSGQPQGLVGNVGTGVIEEPDSGGHAVSLSGILDLIGSLKGMYHENASFLMSRATSVVIRKAQVASNLFEPAWTRVGQQDYLFGYPVQFTSSLADAARGTVPVLFGDFKRGYIIGDRGGSGISVKVLDQPKAAQGLVTLLTYRRTDGRVRVPEAIQPYYVSAS